MSGLPLDQLTLAGFLDASSGRGGDYAAIATVGRDRDGIFYVLEAWMRRNAPPTRQIEAIFERHARWGYTFFGIEANCFQQLLMLPIEEERRRRRAAAAPEWRLPVREIAHHQPKESRIASLEPLAANGWLRFADDLPAALWNELDAFPGAPHDDGLDAVEGAVSLLKSLEPLPAAAIRGPQRRANRPLRNF